MKEIVVLTPPDARYGFALTGVRHQVVEGHEAWAALQALCREPAVGVVAIDARLLARVEAGPLHELAEHWGGVLVTLPAPAGSDRPPLDDLQRLVRRALGYHVRLEP